MKMKVWKIGTLVRVKSKDKLMNEFNANYGNDINMSNTYFINSMWKYCGAICRIESVCNLGKEPGHLDFQLSMTEEEGERVFSQEYYGKPFGYRHCGSWWFPDECLEVVDEEALYVDINNVYKISNDQLKEILIDAAQNYSSDLKVSFEDCVFVFDEESCSMNVLSKENVLVPVLFFDKENFNKDNLLFLFEEVKEND